jgi:DNA-binding HxlR family transcriptional regulator
MLEALAEKWALLPLLRLGEGPRRPSGLRPSVGGISEKMLARTLRPLERDDFVARRDFGEAPPRVDYALTPLGGSLAGVARIFDRWVEEHLFEIIAVQGAMIAVAVRRAPIDRRPRCA